MNDFDLFLKYNLIPTNTLEKNDKVLEILKKLLCAVDEKIIF